MMMVGLGACAGGGPPKLVARGATADVRPEADRRCAHWIVGAAAAAAEQRVIVLGGGYGTAEAPRFVAGLACQLGAKAPVVVALEWPRQLASQLTLLLGGSKTAEERLRAHPLWSDATLRSEGGATRAMWQLLEELRALKAAGIELTVVPFGAELGSDVDDPSERWYRQNAVLSALRRYADATFVVWVDEEDGAYAPGESDTLAASLREQYAQLRSFLLEQVGAAPSSPGAAAGAAPAAAAGASPVAAAGAAAAPWALELRREVAGYDGVFRVGATSDSPQLVSEREASAAAPR